MDRIIAVAAKAFSLRDQERRRRPSVIILPVQRPAEIVNYQSTEGTPVLLASGLATGAVIALAVALVATAFRQRRQDLFTLKTLGFTRGQLAVTLTWQATVTALVGIVIGVPVGIAAGPPVVDHIRPKYPGAVPRTVGATLDHPCRGWGAGARQPSSPLSPDGWRPPRQLP